MKVRESLALIFRFDEQEVMTYYIDREEETFQVEEDMMKSQTIKILSFSRRSRNAHYDRYIGKKESTVSIRV